MWKPCPQPISLERRESVSWTDLFFREPLQETLCFFLHSGIFQLGFPKFPTEPFLLVTLQMFLRFLGDRMGKWLKWSPQIPWVEKNATMINGESTMKVDHVLGEMCIDWVRSKIFSLHSSNDWFRSLSTWHDEFPFYPWCQMVPMFPIFLNEVVQVVLMLQMVPGTKKHWLNSWTNKLCPLQASFFEMVPSGYLTVRHGIDGPLK